MISESELRGVYVCNSIEHNEFINNIYIIEW